MPHVGVARILSLFYSSVNHSKKTKIEGKRFKSQALVVVTVLPEQWLLVFCLASPSSWILSR